MAVYVHNLTIIAGADYSQDYDMLETGGEVIDLTNYTAKAQLRKHKGSATAVSFTVGFPNRTEGKINMSIPSWTTANLKEGRYVYDVLFTKPGGKKEIVLEGRVHVRAGISTGCDFTKPTSAQRLCISVIDEADSQSVSHFSAKWEEFRNTYPNRTFYLLQPTQVGFGVSVDSSNYATLRCPDNFLAETTVNVSPLI
tara:strand:+ start:184 stop:774 length:591 start_codon:yes stop_codon:yes gene_type:complete